MKYLSSHELVKLASLAKYNQIISRIERRLDRSELENVVYAFANSKIGRNDLALDYLNPNLSRKNYSTDLEYFDMKLMVTEVLLQSNNQIMFPQLYNELDNIEFDDHTDESFYRDFLNLLESEYLIGLEKYGEALSILEQLQHRELPGKILGRCLHNLGTIFAKMDDHSNAIAHYSKALDHFKPKDCVNERALTLNHLGILHASKKRIESAKDYFNEVLELQTLLENTNIKAKACNNLGIIYRMEGNMETSLEYYEKSKRFKEELGNTSELQTYYLNAGNNKLVQGDFNEALHLLRKAKTSSSKTENKSVEAKIFSSIGLTHKRLGQFKQALYYYQKALTLAKQVNDPSLISGIQNNYAVIHNIQGNIEDALSNFQEVREIAEKTNDSLLLAKVLTNMGITYNKLDKYRDAIDALEDAYEVKQNLGNNIEISTTLFHLIQIEVDQNNLEKANHYLKAFEQLTKFTTNKEVISRYNMAKASILQQSDDEDDQILVSQLIEEVLSGEYVNFEVNIFAMIAFCEFLIMELRSNNSEEVFHTLQTTLESLYHLASENESHDLIAKTLIIQAKLALLKFETNEAIYYLQQAQQIADSHNLEEVKMKLTFIESQVQSSLYDVTDKLYDHTNTELEQRIDELEIMDYIKNLYYQKQANDILRSDIQNIRRFNDELANLIQINDQIPISLENLANIVELTSREINTLYNSLLLLEKLENETYQSETNEINLTILIEDLIDIYQPGLVSNNQYFNVETFPKEDLVVKVDGQLLENILDHLFLNVIKFTPKNGQIQVSLASDGKDIELILQNDSPVIPDEILQQLPTKYFQYSSEDKLVKGYGIGLTFVTAALDTMDHQYTMSSPKKNDTQGFEIVINLRNVLE